MSEVAVLGAGSRVSAGLVAVVLTGMIRATALLKPHLERLENFARPLLWYLVREARCRSQRLCTRSLFLAYLGVSDAGPAAIFAELPTRIARND